MAKKPRILVFTGNGKGKTAAVFLKAAGTIREMQRVQHGYGVGIRAQAGVEF